MNRLGPEHSLKFVEHTFHLPNTTTIHTHGLHVSPSGIEDNVFRVLYSGQEAVSEYHIRDDHQRTYGPLAWLVDLHREWDRRTAFPVDILCRKVRQWLMSVCCVCLSSGDVLLPPALPRVLHHPAGRRHVR